MYIRKKTRTKDGKRHDYWALVESYRTERGPRQRTVAWLGELDKSMRLGIEKVAIGFTLALECENNSKQKNDELCRN